MPVALFGLPLQALAQHYAASAEHVLQLGLIPIDHHARLYAEMVWAIGRWRFGYKFSVACQKAGWDERAGPIIEGVAKTVSYQGAL